jgi:hypothetical protein
MRVGWGGEFLFCPTHFSLIAFLRHGSILQVGDGVYRGIILGYQDQRGEE